MYHLSERLAVLMDTTLNTLNGSTLTTLKMSTEPVTNMIMLNRWPCGFNAKKQYITRLLIMPGGSLGRLQAWTPLMDKLVVGLTAQLVVLAMGAVWMRMLVRPWITFLCSNIRYVVCVLHSQLSLIKVVVQAHYKVAKYPSHYGVSILQLQSDYNVPKFLATLEHFLRTCMTCEKVVLPMESDWFNIFSRVYVKSGPSMVTGRGNVWRKICAKLEVTACGCKPESPTKFDTAFVWDEGHQ